MIRKLISAGALLSVLAAPAWAGFYVGAGGGPDMGNFDVNAHVYEYHAPYYGFNVKNLEETSATGGFGTIYAGYATPLSRIGLRIPYVNLALELNANGSSLKHENANDEFVHKSYSSTTYRVDYSFGASILPGYMISDATTFYGRIGYANGRFKVTTSDVSLANVDRHLSGIRWGLGLQQMIAYQLALRVEYSHIDYRSVTINTFDALSSVTKITTFTPHTNEVEFSLLYKFS